MQRGPIPADCATRWRRDYMARRFTGNKEYDAAFKNGKKQETIGPFYEPADQDPTCYPVFSAGSLEDIRFYEEPLECTLYAIPGSSILYQTTRNEKAVPLSELPSEMQLSQLTQELLTEQEESNDRPTFIQDTQAYHVLYPKFKQIVSVCEGNSRILGMAMQAMRDAYGMVLAEVASEKVSSISTNNCSAHSDIGRFASSNLELDMYKKSNKRIRPIGERAKKP
jgi:hypothetical protein